MELSDCPLSGPRGETDTIALTSVCRMLFLILLAFHFSGSDPGFQLLMGTLLRNEMRRRLVAAVPLLNESILGYSVECFSKTLRFSESPVPLGLKKQYEHTETGDRTEWEAISIFALLDFL